MPVYCDIMHDSVVLLLKSALFYFIFFYCLFVCFSSLEPSRIRLPQWSTDFNAVINSSIEILLMLEQLG